ncbi:MAG: hypothetical protein US40_C0019G0002 [Candidatus Roizmanbacteria bacterium GW2011_GWC2_37_13]|uniref:Uncharacterized protein n=1 Tax=Candidatus Roizmanbacteria bacterium GW2011_GWC2_37_13 TaxID=1618486 RepID=A0A0G0J7F0_9BACT|nr:MAG: hypothetical protein US40_C0019G0002 [Candidatus Roizmanbacteria bacterium GW2011_GWC2_37_13]
MLGIIALLVFLVTSKVLVVSAQGMMGYFNSSIDKATIQDQQAEEQEGKVLLNNLANKTTTCPKLSNADFEKIGEYFMGRSIGNTQRHISMNEMMKRMMGEKGEEQAHQAMGKRLSGCDAYAAFPTQDAGFLPMMGMLAGSTGIMGNFYGSMMNNGWGLFGGLTWILITIFLILGIIYFWKGISKKK